MHIIADVIVVAILLLCIYSGYKRGLAGCAIKLLSFIIAVVVSFMFFKPVSNFVIDNTKFDDNIKTSIVQIFESESEDDNKEEKENSPILKYVSNELEKATEEKKKEMVDSTAQDLSVKITNVIVFIALFVAIRFALIFVKELANLITKLPLIKQCDKIGGVAYGTLQGALIIFILLALIALVSTAVNNYVVINIINKSYIARELFNNNILINIIF